MAPTPGESLGGIQAQIGPVLLGAVDDAGVEWHLATLEGWDSPEVRAEVIDRESDHGSWDTPAYYGSRPVTLGGLIVAPDLAALDAAMDRLLSAVSLTSTTLTVYQTTPRQATVRRSGKPLLAYISDTVASYSVLVTAPDPRRYATTETSTVLRLPTVSGGLMFPVTFPISFAATVVSGDTAVTNAGNFETRPQIRIAGPVSQPQVTVTAPDGTASTLLYSGDIAAGDWLDLDCDGRTVYYNGIANRRALLTGSWPTLVPGTSGLAFRAGAYSSTATCTVTFRSAWM